MIRIIGGAPRTGKSLLSRRLLAELGLPYLSVDILKMGLVNGAPELGVDPEASTADVARKLWPIVRAMAVNMIETGDPHVIEGEVLPEQVDALARAYPGQVRGCFLGYAQIDPERKLRAIREHGGHPNDWVADCPDDYVRALAADGVAFSRLLAAECERLGIAYFDTSQDFAQALDAAADYLRA